MTIDPQSPTLSSPGAEVRFLLSQGFFVGLATEDLSREPKGTVW